jgi:hypothetical protein
MPGVAPQDVLDARQRRDLHNLDIVPLTRDRHGVPDEGLVIRRLVNNAVIGSERLQNPIVRGCERQIRINHKRLRLLARPHPHRRLFVVHAEGQWECEKILTSRPKIRTRFAYPPETDLRQKSRT